MSYRINEANRILIKIQGLNSKYSGTIDTKSQIFKELNQSIIDITHDYSVITKKLQKNSKYGRYQHQIKEIEKFFNDVRELKEQTLIQRQEESFAVMNNLLEHVEKINS